MDVFEPVVRNSDVCWLDAVVPLNFTALARDAFAAPACGVTFDVWPDKLLSDDE